MSNRMNKYISMKDMMRDVSPANAQSASDEIEDLELEDDETDTRKHLQGLLMDLAESKGAKRKKQE